MYAVSEFLGNGLMASGLSMDDFVKYTSKDPYKGMSFDAFQKSFDLLNKQKDRLNTALGGSDDINTVFAKYLQMSQTERLRFEQKLEAVERLK